MSKFKVGDRVRFSEAVLGPKGLNGRVGIVVGIEPYSIEVAFDGWENGHDGELNDNRTKNRWYCGASELELVGRPLTVDDFKPGDRVRLINGSTMAAQVGAKATVTGFQEYVGTKYLSIVWDRPSDLVGKQMDGGYSPNVFEKIDREEAPRFIVVNIRGTSYLPAANPVIHYTLEAAEKEAQRLAGAHQGQTFRILQMGKAFKSTVQVNIEEVA